MVTTIIIAIAVLGAITLLAFKGITIHYDKHFTIEDNRNANRLTGEELKKLEDKLNAKLPAGSQSDIPEDDNRVGPMDSVIKEMHDLFGPDPDKEERRGGR